MTRPVRDARLLAIGTELTTGATRDTNSGDLARELTALGVRVMTTTALPDELERVSYAFRAALEEADLVISTGGLGPTPDDLTREAIAAACDSDTYVDDELLAWLEELFARRGTPMPPANRKQAWLIPGASALPNGYGSAPGWWVERSDGRIIVALPGPPREMWPMWREHVLPRLRERGLGVDRASRTLRLTGVGESTLVGLIGEEMLRAANPVVATYARPDAVDVVVSATGDGQQSAAQLVNTAVGTLRDVLAEYVFGEGDISWVDALAERLAGRTLATVEIASAGQLVALLGTADFLVHAEMLNAEGDLPALARQARDDHAADVGLAVSVRQRRDSHVRVAIAFDSRIVELQRTAFMAGAEGQRRAALAAAAALWQTLGEEVQ